MESKRDEKRRKRRALLAIITAVLLALLAEPVAVAGAALGVVGGGMYLVDPVRVVPETVHTVKEHSIAYTMPRSCDAAWAYYPTSAANANTAWDCPRGYTVWPSSIDLPTLGQQVSVVSGQPVYVELTDSSPDVGLMFSAAGATIRPASALIVASWPAEGSGSISVSAQAPAVNAVTPPKQVGDYTQATQAWMLEYARPGVYTIDVGMPAVPAQPLFTGGPDAPAVPATPDWRQIAVTVTAAPAGAVFRQGGAPTVPAGVVWWPGSGSAQGGSFTGGRAQTPRFDFTVTYGKHVMSGRWGREPMRQPLLSVQSLSAAASARWTATGTLAGAWPIQPPAWVHAAPPTGPSAIAYPIRFPAVVETMPVTVTRHVDEPLLLAAFPPGQVVLAPARHSASNLLPLVAGLLLLLLALRRVRRRLHREGLREAAQS